MLLASATTLPLVLAATGCRSSEAFAGPDPLGGPPPPSPDVITLEAVIAAEANLIQAYKTAISGDSRATAKPGNLTTLLTQHEQHLAQLQAHLVVPPGQGGRDGQGGQGGSGSPGGQGGRGGLRGTTSPQTRGVQGVQGIQEGQEGQGGRGGLGGSGGQAVPPSSGGSRGVAPPGLAQLERTSAAYLVRQLAAAQPSLAQLFASIAACHATHVAALGA